MEIKNLNKTLSQIFAAKYVVPLYQRNFAWSDDEIGQLLQDLYDSFKKEKNNNYYIGSLVVLKRKNGDFEVIDGQQRLTAISLIAKVLEVDFAKEPKLYYDSRQEVESFFSSFYHNGKTDDVTFDHKVSHLVHAVDVIKETVINPDEKNPQTLLGIDNLNEFKDFFSKQVIIVRVEIPQETDVAAYFEIMNNRGEQLQKHEILKARLMDKIKSPDGKHNKKKQEQFSIIWDACSQMDIPVQKLFNKDYRVDFFGNEYLSYTLTEDYFDNGNDSDSTSKISDFTIDDILSDEQSKGQGNPIINDVDDESDDKSIIDFPNFLMHVFKLEYNDVYSSNVSKDIKDRNIPLNEKDLLTVFKVISESINPIKFIIRLLYYRTVFDKYIIKSTVDEQAEDNYKWSLEKPYKYVYEKRKTQSLKYSPTFNNQERIIKCLSLMQVTFRNRKYKNWLQDILSWFSNPQEFNMGQDEYQSLLDNWLYNYFSNHFYGIEIKSYSEGTRTPHFLFNFIDYLYWVQSQDDSSKFNFEYKYRNSVEHHLPQSFRNESNKGWIDNIGNLCLLSKSYNSRMNNEDPKGKASKNGKYYKSTLPPKQKVMYDLTNNRNNWRVDEILEHGKDVSELLINAESILCLNQNNNE